ncbi:radical SAM/SPASM domain-containing protein [Roseburia hominis]|uniref:Radical SAM protein n=1 Tax=Roseburia hominis TaxID=301301 RepID=A0A395V3M6_9FIRM|nr:radical SAM protein [Roseburia hominis]RGS37161.1 radical SAM protein [Roseburia hominis]
MSYSNIIKSYSQDRNVLGKVLPLDTPYTVLIDISDSCNLRCKYCFRYDTSIGAEDYRKNRLMDWETFQIVVEQLKEFPSQIKRIALSHNGEPLCNRKLPQMVSYIKNAGLTGRTEIHTNGLLLDKQYIEELCEAGIDRVVISLQGLDGDAYYKECGVRIDFERFYYHLKYFYQKKRDTQIHIKIVDEAVGEERDRFYEMFSPIADRVFVESVVPLWTDSDMKTGEVEKNKYGDTFKVQQCCPLVFYTINVLPDGTIYPCSHIRPPFKLGNVKETTIYEAWNGAQKKTFMKDMLESGRFKMEACKNCYIPQNTVMTPEDSIDAYAEEILERINRTQG